MNLIVQKSHFSTKVDLNGYLVSHDKDSVVDELNMSSEHMGKPNYSQKKNCAVPLCPSLRWKPVTKRLKGTTEGCNAL